MPERCFTDPDVKPTEKSICDAVGRAKSAWINLFDKIHSEHPDLVKTWKYYKDGHSWLCQVTWKKMTVCWISVLKGQFVLAFYFATRLNEKLLESDLSEERKKQIAGGPEKGKLGAVQVEFGPQKGIKDVMTLIELKKTLK